MRGTIIPPLFCVFYITIYMQIAIANSIEEHTTTKTLNSIDKLNKSIHRIHSANSQPKPPTRAFRGPLYPYNGTSVFVRLPVNPVTNYNLPKRTTERQRFSNVTPKPTDNVILSSTGPTPHSHVHHHGDHSHENGTYNYSGLHHDWHEENHDDDDDDGLIRHLGGRRDICAKCLCKHDLSRVVCEHRHTNIEDRDHNLYIEQSFIPTATRSIEIKGYETVSIVPNAFSRSNLKYLTFKNIGDIIMKKNSLYFSPNAKENAEMTIRFINCNVTTFPTGALTQEMQGEHGRHSRLGLTNIRFLSLEIKKCRIQYIEQYAFSGSRILYLTISETIIGDIKTRGMDLQVYELSLFEKNIFPALVTEALCLHAKKVVFKNNFFREIGSRAITIETDSQILFAFNKVALLKEKALLAMHPMKKYGPNLVFHTNVVSKAEPKSLVIDPLFPVHERKLFNNTFQVICNCTIQDFFHSIMGTSPNYYDAESFQIFLRQTKCQKANSETSIAAHTYLEEECSPFPVIAVACASVAFVLFIVAITICVVCSIRVQHMRDEAKSLGECTSQSFSTLNRQGLVYQQSPCNTYEAPYSPIWIQPNGGEFTFAVAVPEVKTYQQREMNEFTEITESIRGSTAGELDFLAKKDLAVLNRQSCPLN